MKNLFLFVLAILVVFSQLINFGKTDAGSVNGKVVWVTVRNPTHVAYVKLYEERLKRLGLPPNPVAIDVNNMGTQKTIVQGVAGVAGDLLDANGSDYTYFTEIGLFKNMKSFPELYALLRPILDASPTLKAEVEVDGEVYGVPTRVHPNLLVVNRDAFRSNGMPIPSYIRTMDEFEAEGRTFVERANRGAKLRVAFYTTGFGVSTLLHSSGLSMLNETATAAATFDDKREALMARYLKWIYDDHLIPTSADMQSIAVGGNSVGNIQFELFARRQLACMWTGRWLAILSREIAHSPDMGTMLPPHGGYPSTKIGVAVMGMYNGTKRVARSADFLKYFLTDDYFNQMVADANGLPIQSLAFKNESFVHPPRWTNEWNFHEGFAQALSTWCTPSECGPILLILDVNRAEQREFGGWEVRHYTAREAWERFNMGLQERIRVRTSGSPQLLEKYKTLIKRQAEIDALKARGEKIPEEWISNPFLKRYYRDTGRLAGK